MFVRTFVRSGAALLLLAFVSGCASGGSGASSLVNKCKWNRSSCMYEGSYEPGEAQYAEEEAKRLNRASSIKFRSSGN
ncbi:hypothetical protein EYW45_23840 [Achromobacter sp. KS-M25]|nr:hypothetical protein [Achromobacter aestuarii]MYZ46023.1 hypothetical protein [Achromobacter aestuarii]